MRRTVAALVAAVVFLLPIRSAHAEELAPFVGVGTRRVVLFADSLGGQAKAAYTSQTQASYATSYNAVGGYTMRLWLPWIDEAIAASPNAIVAALGVNDYRAGGDQLAYWHQAGALLRGRCWVWVEYYQPLLNWAAQQWANQARAVVVHYGGIVYREWNNAARLNPGWFQADGIHLKGNGPAAYASHLRAAQARCP